MTMPNEPEKCGRCWHRLNAPLKEKGCGMRLCPQGTVQQAQAVAPPAEEWDLDGLAHVGPAKTRAGGWELGQLVPGD
jgi:hypothetical protein